MHLKRSFKIYFNQPALRITARLKNNIRHAQVALFKVDSALLALVNMELPLDARPPIPSPFGLWRRTSKIRNTPEIAQAQDKIGIIIFLFNYAGWGIRFVFLGKLIGSISVEPVIAFGFGKFNKCKRVGAKSDNPPPDSLSFISLP